MLRHLFPSTAIIARIASVPYLPLCAAPEPDLDPILITLLSAHADNGLVENCIHTDRRQSRFHSNLDTNQNSKPNRFAPCGLDDRLK